MSIKIETLLSSGRKAQIESLVSLCLKASPAPLSVPADGDVYFFMEKPSTSGHGSAELWGLLALYETEEHLWECSAFTRPDKQQTGIFSALLDAAENTYPDDQFSFPVPDSKECLPALKTLEAIGAELWYQEHLMTLESDSPAWNTLLAMPDNHLLSLSKEPYDLAEEGDSQLIQAFSEGLPIASCALTITCQNGRTSCCIHHVFVPESLRNKGYGTLFLKSLLPQLKQQGISRFLLQVSGSNLPAIALYKKTGFRITETLSYYLY